MGGQQRRTYPAPCSPSPPYACLPHTRSREEGSPPFHLISSITYLISDHLLLSLSTHPKEVEEHLACSSEGRGRTESALFALLCMRSLGHFVLGGGWVTRETSSHACFPASLPPSLWGCLALVSAFHHQQQHERTLAENICDV